MNLKELKEMISLMNENQLSELEMERDGLKIRLRKGPSGIQQEIIHTTAQPPPTQPQPETSAQEASTKGLIEIKSPMVGTFYRASSPEAPPYVEEGGDLNEGQVICIIEAMKLMNEIKSEVSGKISKILVENGDPVEFGQVLLLIESTG